MHALVMTKTQTTSSSRENLLSYEKLRCRMSLRVNFFHSHLDFLLEKLRPSEKHGETFHPDSVAMERHPGKRGTAMEECGTVANRSTDVIIRL